MIVFHIVLEICPAPIIFGKRVRNLGATACSAPLVCVLSAGGVCGLQLTIFKGGPLPCGYLGFGKCSCRTLCRLPPRYVQPCVRSGANAFCLRRQKRVCGCPGVNADAPQLAVRSHVGVA